MSFGLTNVGATFQRAMDATFRNLMFKMIVVYLDDLIIFSNDHHGHIKDLYLIFKRCREFEVSLNPNKYLCCESWKIDWTYYLKGRNTS